MLVLGLLVPGQAPVEQRQRLDALKRALGPASDPRLRDRLGRQLARVSYRRRLPPSPTAPRAVGGEDGKTHGGSRSHVVARSEPVRNLQELPWDRQAAPTL